MPVGLSFSFAKKAEPKRVVEALAQKKDDGRIAITALEGGQVTVDGKAEAESKLTIACKNPLENRGPRLGPDEARRAAEASKRAKEALEGGAAEGGLLKRPAPDISAEDAEALRELRRDIDGGGGVGDSSAVAAAPILMREGSKRVRDGDAPDATKEMFEKVPVEAFGEALLRGMGFDPTKHKTKPVFHDKLRDTHLGLGAKALLPSEKLPPARGKAKAAAAPAAAEAQASAAAAAPPPASEAATAGGGSPSARSPPEAAGGSSPRAAAADGGAEAKRPRRGDTAAPPAAEPLPAADCWPSRGLVVRVCGRAADPQLRKFRGLEAVVLEADAAAMLCRIKGRIDGQSHVLQKVPVSDLEPTISADCAKVRIIRGKHKGADASLVRRSSRQNAVWVQISTAECQLPAGDVCEFIAPKR